MIRRANFSDLGLLHYLGRKTFEDTFGGTCTKADMKEVLDRFFNKEQCAFELLDEQDYFFFLEEEGVVKGYIRLHDKHDCPIPDCAGYRCMELVRCYFLKEYHGTGAANELLHYAVSFARDKGYEKLYLSVWEYNFRARGFYEKHGFVNSGIENDFPLGSTPQTDLWFVKDLK
jgi:diamine N-acetyltransferase